MYPSIIRLVDKDILEKVLGDNFSFDNTLLAKIFYGNHVFDKSRYGDEVTHSLDLIFGDSLGIEIPGLNGTKLLLNPSATGGTQVPLSFNYNLVALKYLKTLSIESITEDPRVILEFLSDLFDVSYEELITKCITILVDDPNPVQKFISDFNAKYSPAVPLVYNASDPYPYLTIAEKALDNNINPLDAIHDLYIAGNDFDTILKNIKALLSSYVDQLTLNDIKELLIPKFSLSIDEIEAALEFPRDLFVPIATPTYNSIPPTTLGEPLPEPYKTRLTFDIGSMGYSSETGFSFEPGGTFGFQKSFILGTKFSLEVIGLKLDLSRTKNIPEATADGRPNDFIGVYITDATIGFPADWNHNSTGSTAELYVHNLLAGTGGISGKIGLRAITAGTLSPVIKITFGSGFSAELDAFDLTFQQNQIIGSNIKGAMTIPGFKDNVTGDDAKIFIDIHIGQDGEFNVVASLEHPMPAIKIPDVFAFDIKSVFIGKKDGRFYIGVSGDIDFLLQDPIGKFLPDKIDIKKLIIYDDGKFEIEGGSIYLPKAFELKLGPAKIGITAIHLGSYEKEGRQYKYFGFDGGVNVNPGGVDARGKGIKYYYTVDGDPFKWFIRLESLAIDIIIPGSAKKEDAAVIIKGFLSIKDPKIDPLTPEPLKTTLKNSTEYAGGVYVSIPKFKGLEASASMKFTPQVPAFIIDLGIEISTPILLGTTGLGIYGFRAIFGKRYVATKMAAEIPEDGEWWQYYKAKIDPDYKEGIQVSKFSIKEGFSIGAGVSLATSSDSGKTFSSKLFFLLSLPDVFLFQGQAQFLKGRISLDSVPDPPFFALIAITKHSIEAGFGINYKMPEETGRLVTVDGVTELGFFFGDSAAWYFNIGRESPDSMRIQARVFDILNMYFYFMISNSGIRAGAGVSFELKKSFGPLSAELKAYIDTKGKISFRPKQIGGAIQMGGTVALKCCGFGFSVSGGATLAAEAPRPHIITGEFEVCVKVLKKQRCAHFEFTWNFEHELNKARNGVLAEARTDGSGLSDLNDLNKVAKANHMVTGETLNLAYKVLNDGQGTSSIAIPHPDAWINGYGPDDFRVPVDTFIDIEFKKGLNVSPSSSLVNNLNKIGGISSPCQFVEFVPPQRGKSDRVRHEYYFEDIEIKYWDENSNTWENYNFYDAMIPMFPGTEQVGALIDPAVLANMKWGYWQQQRPGFNNKLRILATTPLSYIAKTGSLPIEDLGITGSTILCPGEPVPETCIKFGKGQVNKSYPANVLNTFKGILIKITTQDGLVLYLPYLGIDNGLMIQPGNTIELFFNEPMRFVNLTINSGAPYITVEYYQRVTVVDGAGEEILSGGLPVFQYELIESVNYYDTDWADEIHYEHSDKNIDYVKITSVSCYEEEKGGGKEEKEEKEEEESTITCLKADESIGTRLSELEGFIGALIENGHFTAGFVELYPENNDIYNGTYIGTSLYPNIATRTLIINLTQGYISSTTLLFTVSDNLGFNCNYSFELLKPVEGFSFNKIESVVSIVPYTTGATAGINYTFLLTVTIEIDGEVVEVQIIGKTCMPTAYCFDKCSTGLYRICYLSYADYLLNQTIPDGSEQEANNDALLEGINKTLQPIWRPNTTFAIRIKTSDCLSREGESSLLVPKFNLDIVYGFKTAGPVGHYHNYAVDNSPPAQVLRQDYQLLDDADRQDDFKLLSLKYYIDFNKCYPNADGDIINAKPLFYVNAELRLFYLYNYVYEFFNDWVDTNTSAANPYVAQSSLEVLVRDPEDSSIPEMNAESGFVGSSISHANPGGTGLPPVNINSINNDISTLNNILLNGNPCAGYTPLAPIDISTKKTLDLKPLKLYTAQFIAKYNPLIDDQYASSPYESLVHSYSFQTSRYSSFEEQVESYILKTDGVGAILKAAVFTLSAETVNSILDLGLATDVITNNTASIPDDIKLQYADQFDRLINGVLHIDYNKLHAAVTTEFNLITHPDTPETVIGILIRNPEPFNDPKLPKADPNLSSTGFYETLEVSRWNSGTSAWESPEEHYVIHSKDRSRIFITPRDFSYEMNISSVLKFTFRYKLYNGVDYADASVVNVEIDLSTYIF
ncbi:MAG: hypothetical protein JWO09_2293 [Bacteroidetes bacterium]|nr:hypothetical protein [Bacteroidota bacterium]